MIGPQEFWMTMAVHQNPNLTLPNLPVYLGWCHATHSGRTRRLGAVACGFRRAFKAQWGIRKHNLCQFVLRSASITC